MEHFTRFNDQGLNLSGWPRVSRGVEFLLSATFGNWLESFFRV